MPDFLTKTSCRGQRPQHLVMRRHCPRPNLIAKLLRERHVPRFIIAPEGYGKTAVASEYCSTVFHFEHVFWIDATSPCFLRDLDDGRIAKTLLTEDRDMFLAVIEDVPPLDSERAQRLCDEIDLMLDRGCEVLVTCTPTCDAFHRHRDRIKLGSTDLLLSDTELIAQRSMAESEIESVESVPGAQRAAVLVWGAPEDRAAFLSSAAREELPADLMLLQFVMLALQAGALDDLNAFIPCNAESLTMLADHYPYLGIDQHLERFATAPFSMAELAEAFSSRLKVLAACSTLLDGDALVTRVADVLVAHHQFERACDAARLLLTRAPRAVWLAERSPELIDGACLAPACQAYRSLSGEKAGKAPSLNLFEAARCALLEDKGSARSLARTVAISSSAPTEMRVAAALIMARCSEGSERRRAGRLAATLVATLDAQSHKEAVDVNMDPQALAAAVAVHTSLEVSCAHGAKAWLSWYEKGVRGHLVTQSAAWVLRCAMPFGGSSSWFDEEGCGEVERVATAVCDLVSCADSGNMSLFEGIVGIALERAFERGVVSSSLDARSVLAVRRVEMSLYEQRAACARFEQEHLERHHAFVATHPDAFRMADRKLPSSGLIETEPTLTVNLFGGLDVRIGEQRVDVALFRRQKVQVLLALLVLNRGREFSRDKLVALLWPDSDLEAARKNFYGIWSMLRRALTTPTGTCPYLIRQQHGLRLEAGLLHSDVMQLDEVCGKLLFEHAGYGGWAHLFSQINEKFSDDILPSENNNDAIKSRRIECRNRLVDALVAASSRLVKAGEVREGLWFARAALQRDNAREDAYVALMEAQIGAGQRSAALETYFACRRYLADELGIDPSVDTMRLYRGIIESEEVLD